MGDQLLFFCPFPVSYVVRVFEAPQGHGKNQGDYTEPDEPDVYCPFVRGEAQELEINIATGVGLPKCNSACTTIVIARDETQ